MSNKEIPFLFAGFIAGALVGVAAALLLAPQSGEETRAQIREKGIELEGKAHETYGQAKTRVKTTTEQIRHKADETVAKVGGAFTHGQTELAEEVEGAAPQEEALAK